MIKNTITFKSIEPYYSKEESGIKNNTLRNINPCDDRLKIINNFIAGEHEIYIKIENPLTNKSFIRTVKDISLYKDLYTVNDISFYKDLYIITWEVE